MASQEIRDVNPIEPDSINQFLLLFKNYVADRKPFRVVFSNPKKRSLDQNALFHVWCWEYGVHITNAGHLTGKAKDKLIDCTKKSIKAKAYNEFGWEFLLTRIKNIFTGEITTEYRSTAEYESGQMYQFMEYVQNIAAQDGLILESKGQFKELKESQNA